MGTGRTVKGAPAVAALRISEPSHEPARRRSKALDGAPLDAIKCVAAASMVCDHLNDMVFHHDYLWLWYAGRLAFPLFCLVLALNLRRGAPAAPYAAIMTPFAILSQPIYKIAFHDGLDNILLDRCCSRSSSPS